ncbi:MAG: D-aminoacyl-tRNA deacylase, partial [Spirochaetota bacterium]
MRAVIQRVRAATVVVKGAITGAIDRGLLVYVGVEEGDGHGDLQFVAKKVAGVRIFEDAEGKMNLALDQLERTADERIGILAVSQFTLHGDLRKGRRPSYNRAAPPESARELYEA